MKTRYKILLIIASSVLVYILIHTVMWNVCEFIGSHDPSHMSCYRLIVDTSIHIPSGDGIWSSGDGIGFWTGTAEGIDEPSVYETLKDNSGFIFWHMILPMFAILLIYQRDRLKK